MSWRMRPLYPGPGPSERESPLSLENRLRRRAEALRQIRERMHARGFLELDPPQLIAANAVETHIDPLEVELRPGFHARRTRGQLHTSPELAMKRAVAAGMERVFFLGHVFRDGERTPQHRPEFTLLEWYRRGGSLDDLVDDCRALFAQLGVYDGEFERATVNDLWREHLHLDLLEALDAGDLVQRMRDLEHALRPEADEEDAFFHGMDAVIEPWLASSVQPVVVERWPARFAALARLRDDDPRVAGRFEVYFRGLELANAFDELTDPEEQRARFIADNASRAALGKSLVPIDEDFLGELGGMPPSAGIALGVERLMMLAAGAEDIEDVLYFPDPFG
jgi:lysyl-tRNA synthetase class 2